MLLERTIAQLDVGQVSAERAQKLGELGYLQWLGALPGRASYRAEALRAYDAAQPFVETSPAVAVFCEMLMTSLRTFPIPLDVAMPPRTRRGGAKARRGAVWP